MEGTMHANTARIAPNASDRCRAKRRDGSADFIRMRGQSLLVRQARALFARRRGGALKYPTRPRLSEEDFLPSDKTYALSMYVC